MNLPELTGHPPMVLVIIALTVFFAALVRGYAGFGFSALTVSALSFIVPVASIVPMVLALEVAASIQMVPKVIRKVDRGLLTLLLVGSAVSVPLGQHLLLLMDPLYARIIVSGLVLVLVAFISSGFSLERVRGKPFYLITAVLSGCANGLVAMGGLVVSSLLLSTALRIEILRATLIAMFFFVGLYAVGIGLINGLVTTHAMMLSLLMIPPLALGVRMGSRRFNPEKVSLYRRITLGLLTFLAVTGIVLALKG